jgi:hypothetical protein
MFRFFARSLCRRLSEPGANKRRRDKEKAAVSNEAPTLFTTKQTGELVRLSARTLEGLRVKGGGPIYRKIAGRVYYAKTDLLGWLKACARTSTSSPYPAEVTA